LAEARHLCYNEKNNKIYSQKGVVGAMKAMLYMQDKKDPVAVLDQVDIVKMNDNHTKSPYRISFATAKLNAGRTMLELHRDQKMLLRLDDGREVNVLLQHSSLDSKGNAVGVLHVLGTMNNE
jgi:hypothetical protein